MHERIKEHDKDIRLVRTQSSPVSELSNARGHYPLWDEVNFIDRDPHCYSCRLFIEGFTMKTYNRDDGIEIQGVSAHN